MVLSFIFNLIFKRYPKIVPYGWRPLLENIQKLAAFFPGCLIDKSFFPGCSLFDDRQTNNLFLLMIYIDKQDLALKSQVLLNCVERALCKHVLLSVVKKILLSHRKNTFFLYERGL